MDDLRALAQRCLPDPTLERFFRDDEPDDGPAIWTPVHLERYAKVLAADGTLERRYPRVGPASLTPLVVGSDAARANRRVYE